MSSARRMGRCLAWVALAGVSCTPLLEAQRHHAGQRGAAADFDAVHIERSQEITLNAGPAEVFPLFEPRGRARWGSQTVDRQFLYPASGAGRAGAVMLVTHPRHDEPQMWLVADYEPPTRIRYVIHIPDAEAWEMEVLFTEHTDGTTVAEVIYRVTALSEPMNHAVRDFFENGFASGIAGWATAINRLLAEERH